MESSVSNIESTLKELQIDPNIIKQVLTLTNNLETAVELAIQYTEQAQTISEDKDKKTENVYKMVGLVGLRCEN